MSDTQMNDTQEKAKSFTIVTVGIWFLSLTATGLFALWITGHDFKKELNKEDRSNIAVGAAVLPQDKIKIEIRNTPASCLQIEQVIFDDDLTMYYRNKCSGVLPYTDIRWQQISTDGTVIESGSTNRPSYELEAGQRGELHMSWMHPDARAVRLVVKVVPNY